MAQTLWAQKAACFKHKVRLAHIRLWTYQGGICKYSQWGRHDRVATTHQHKIGHFVQYLQIQWPGHVPPADTTLVDTQQTCCTPRVVRSWTQVHFCWTSSPTVACLGCQIHLYLYISQRSNKEFALLSFLSLIVIGIDPWTGLISSQWYSDVVWHCRFRIRLD